MLDLYREITSYSPIENDIIQNSIDKDKKAYDLYNRALVDVKTKNEDIAFIKLKKAIALKPDFYLAKLILGVHYAHSGKYKKAIELFEDVVNHDKDYGVTALKYLRLLNVDIEKKELETNNEIDGANSEQVNSYVVNYQKDSKSVKRTISLILLGVFIGALLMVPVILMQKDDEADNNKSNELGNDVDQYIRQINELTQQNESQLEDYDRLSDDYEKLKERLDKESKLVAQYQNTIEHFDTFLAIEELIAANKYIEAADNMKVLMENSDAFEGELEEKLTRLYRTAMDEAASYCENRGVELFNAGSYEESIALLLRTTDYRENYERMYRIVYYIAKNQMELMKYEEARENFLEVTRLAPNQEWINYANQKLAEVEDLMENPPDENEENDEATQ